MIEEREKTARREAEVMARARVLAEAYRKTGAMTVILGNGSRLTDTPHVTGEAIQDIRNAIYKAVDMARAHACPPITPTPEFSSKGPT